MIFFEDANNFSFHAVPFKTGEELKSGLWLVLSGIDETPPHIALISEGKYYSVSARKVDCGSPSERLLTTLKRKHIPAVFIRFETKDEHPFLEKTYTNVEPLGNNEKTCLSPIKEVFAKYYSSVFSKINYVFELLALAKKEEIIKECLYLPAELKETNTNIVTLPKYTMAQIQNKIRTLSTQHTTINTN